MPIDDRPIHHENLLLKSVPREERERLRPYLEPVYLEQQQKLAALDKPIDAVYFPHDCVTSTLMETDEGASIEVGLMGADGMVGVSLIFGELTSNSTVVVQIPGEATKMSAENFERHVVARRGPLYAMVQRYVNAFMGMIAQSAVCNSLHPMTERMWRWILMTHDRVRQDQISLNQKFLAMMLGVRGPTVATVARTLKEAGLIDYTRTSITVLDRRGLEESSCECYGIINRQYNKVFQTEWRDK